MKPRIVLSGVNFTEMGALAIFKDALYSLASEHGDKFDIIALVHRRDLFDTSQIVYREFPKIKTSWLRRLKFEYVDCKRLSKEIKPHLWLAMHDITPNVTADKRVVYCHNPAPFYGFTLRESLFDWKLGAFTLFYNLLYRINIRSNKFIIVQQDWLRSQFKDRFQVDRIIVAHPDADFLEPVSNTRVVHFTDKIYRFFYPAYPRTFKNLEVIMRAAEELEPSGDCQFEIWVTCDETITKYAKHIVDLYGHLKSIRWLGILSREQVFQRYIEADCLLFPSKLETWGMPITEFKKTGKPIIASDLPYAHETVGDYPTVAFFSPTDSSELAKIMRSAALGLPVFGASVAAPIAPLFSRNWQELWRILLELEDSGSEVLQTHAPSEHIFL